MMKRRYEKQLVQYCSPPQNFLTHLVDRILPPGCALCKRNENLSVHPRARQPGMRESRSLQTDALSLTPWKPFRPAQPPRPKPPPSLPLCARPFNDARQPRHPHLSTLRATLSRAAQLSSPPREILFGALFSTRRFSLPRWLIDIEG